MDGKIEIGIGFHVVNYIIKHLHNVPTNFYGIICLSPKNRNVTFVTLSSVLSMQVFPYLSFEFCHSVPSCHL